MNTVTTYSGLLATIKFQLSTENLITVSLKTEHLFLRSMEEEDIPHYIRLFGDRTVMSTYSTGQIHSEEKVHQLFQENMRYRHANNPYHHFSVRLGESFIGMVALTQDARPGIAELAGAGFSEYWGKGYGTEAAGAVVKEYASATVKQGYLIHGKPLYKIFATAQAHNTPCFEILRKTLRMHIENPFSQERVYSISIA